jgi:hypothetical protein
MDHHLVESGESSTRPDDDHVDRIVIRPWDAPEMGG